MADQNVSTSTGLVILLLVGGIVGYFIMEEKDGNKWAREFFNIGLSKEQISETIKSGLQEKFSTDAQLRPLNLTVGAVEVLSKGGNQYQGLAKVNYKSKPHDVPVEITADGNKVMWKIDPGGFGFLLQN